LANDAREGFLTREEVTEAVLTRGGLTASDEFFFEVGLWLASVGERWDSFAENAAVLVVAALGSLTGVVWPFGLATVGDLMALDTAGAFSLFMVSMVGFVFV
jgi:hypothetical protein